MPTTLKTSTTTSESIQGSPGVAYPIPTGTKSPSRDLPDNPNYPWGGNSPVHRHHNVTELKEGVEGGLQGRGSWPGWGDSIQKLKSLWQQQKQDMKEED